MTEPTIEERMDVVTAALRKLKSGVHVGMSAVDSSNVMLDFTLSLYDHLPAILAELETTRQENAKLLAALRECADELEEAGYETRGRHRLTAIKAARKALGDE